MDRRARAEAAAVDALEEARVSVLAIGLSSEIDKGYLRNTEASGALALAQDLAGQGDASPSRAAVTPGLSRRAGGPGV